MSDGTAMTDVPSSVPETPAPATAADPHPSGANSSSSNSNAAASSNTAAASSSSSAATSANGLPATPSKPSGGAPVSAAPASGSAPVLAKKPVLIPKKVMPGATATPTAKPVPIGGPKPLPKPITAGGAAAKPAAAAAGGAGAAAAKPLVKKPLVKKEAASSSSDSGSDSDSSSSSSEDDEPLVKAKSATVKAPPAPAAAKKPAAAAAATPRKRASEDSSSEDSDSSSSESDVSVGKKRKKPAARAKKAPVKRARKATGGRASGSKYAKKSSKGSGDDESGSDADGEDREGQEFDEKKVILYPMDKYILRENVEPLKELKGANKWWNRPRAPGDKTKWETLEHNGILFPAAYVPHGKPLLYDNEEMILSPEQEEVASMWALMDEKYTSQPTFAKNFFRDFKALFPAPVKVKDLAKCDFTLIKAHLVKERDSAKLIKKHDAKARAREREEKAKLQEIYGWALVDGYKEKVANFNVEPPNLFRGRGEHPKTGTLKRRVQPEDIIINIGPNTPLPRPPPGHKWKGVIHNNKVTWLAFYRDNVNGDFKYIWLAPSSRFKGESDIKKYTKAQKLKKYIDEIRKNYQREMRSEHSQFRQRATAIYLIDQLALRVGNEKDATEVADTVGCCSLRVEHLTFTPPCSVTFDFLGKDSMRYYNTVELDPQAYKNLKSFTEKKKSSDEVFDAISTSLLNEHLKTLMPELTAKVFRTYNASVTLEKELYKTDISPEEHPTTKRNFYNAANREVAILCNHQRSIPKGHDAAIQKLKETMEAIVDDRDEMEDWIEELEGKKNKTADKRHKERAEARATRRAARLERQREEAKTKYLKAKEERAKLRAVGQTVSESESEPEDWGVKEKSRSMPSDLTRAQAALKKLKERLVTHEASLATKDQTKDVALGTSKINYMDPRITVAFCKAKELPLESVFNRSLVAKFPWAMEVPPDWRF